MNSKWSHIAIVTVFPTRCQPWWPGPQNRAPVLSLWPIKPISFWDLTPVCKGGPLASCVDFPSHASYFIVPHRPCHDCEDHQEWSSCHFLCLQFFLLPGLSLPPCFVLSTGLESSPWTPDCPQRACPLLALLCLQWHSCSCGARCAARLVASASLRKASSNDFSSFLWSMFF